MKKEYKRFLLASLFVLLLLLAIVGVAAWLAYHREAKPKKAIVVCSGNGDYS
jgi:hypothetical protein